MSTKKTSQSEPEAQKAPTETPAPVAKVVSTDNSRNGYLAARREQRAKAQKGAKS